MLFFVILNFFIINIFAEKFCVNCKFFIKSTFCNEMYGRCAIFPVESETHNIDYLISGNNKFKEYRFCSSARTDENLCGITGKYYEKHINFFPKLKNLCLLEKL